MAYEEDSELAAPPGERPLIRAWETEAVVFNPSSGDTHLLSLPAADVLRSILQQPIRYGDLQREFSRQNGAQVDADEAGDYFADTVEKLVALDLIQRVEVAPA